MKKKQFISMADVLDVIIITAKMHTGERSFDIMFLKKGNLLFRIRVVYFSLLY
jgi:hypothetical protein